MSTQLSAGALRAISEGSKVEKPVFQFLALKKLNPTPSTNNAVDRYRILLSDGVHNNTAMLAVQLNQMVTDGQLEANTVVCLDRYVCNKLAGNRQVVIILEVTVVASASEAGGKIGNPVALVPVAGGGTANGQQAPAAQQQQPVSTGASPMSVAKGNSFSGRGTGSFNKPSGSFGGAGPSGAMSPPKQAQPISSLNPYQNRWTIKARVSNKSAVRTWNNSKGSGKLFSMDLCDQSGEIRATAFKEQCEKFHDMIEVGKVYFISRGSVKAANRQFTSIPNDYELTFNNETTMVPCEEEDDSIPTMQFDFRTIGQLEDISKDSILGDSGDAGGDSGERVSTAAVTKPTAMVTPVAAVTTAVSGSQMPSPQAVFPGHGHQMAFIRPVSGGQAGNQQMMPAFPIFTQQRVPGPGPNQQMFAVPGAPPMIRIVHHHHAVPGQRAPTPQSVASPQGGPATTSTVAGTTSASSTVTGSGQGFQIHFHHRPGYPPQPVVRIIQGGPPQQGGSFHAHPGVTRCMHTHPVFATPVPAGAAPAGAPPIPAAAPAPAPAAAAVPPAAAAPPITSIPPQPSTRNSSSTTSAPQPPPCAIHGRASAMNPVRHPKKSQPDRDDKPELAELAQHIRNITADVKTVKPGSRGVPLDPRERQRREAAEATINRRKEVKARGKTSQAEEAKAGTDDPSSKVQEGTAPDKTQPQDEGSSISGDSTRRRKRRKRAKQQSPSQEETEQGPALDEGKTSFETGKGDSKAGDIDDEHNYADVASAKSDSHPPVEAEVSPSPKPDGEERPVYDSDDITSSESESEEVSNLNTLDSKSSSEPSCQLASGPPSPSLEKCPNQDNKVEDAEAQDDNAVSQSSSEIPAEGKSGPSPLLASESGVCQESSRVAEEEHETSDQSAQEVLSAEASAQQPLPHPDLRLEEGTPGVVPLSGRKDTDKLVETKAVPANQSVLNKKHSVEDIHQKEVDTKSQPDSRLDDSTKSSQGDKPSASTEPPANPTSQKVTERNPESRDQQRQNPEPQPDRLDFERRQLVLERKRLDCERQQILQTEERLQMEQDRLQIEREHLHALQEQVKLQQDRLVLDRTRLDLQRDHLEVDRDRLQIEHRRLRVEEQRDEDSKNILKSLQEINQTLQMSVSLSLQGYGFPVPYDSDDQSYIETGAQGGWVGQETLIPEEGSLDAAFDLAEQPLDDDGDDWTVVGGQRASQIHHQIALHEDLAAEGAVGTTNMWTGAGSPVDQTTPNPPSGHIHRPDEAVKRKPPAKGQRSSGQRLGEGRSSPVHELSSIGEKQEDGTNTNQRPHRHWRHDNQRGRNNDRRRWKPNETKRESSK